MHISGHLTDKIPKYLNSPEGHTHTLSFLVWLTKPIEISLVTVEVTVLAIINSGTVVVVASGCGTGKRIGKGKRNSCKSNKKQYEP